MTAFSRTQPVLFAALWLLTSLCAIASTLTEASAQERKQVTFGVLVDGEFKGVDGFVHTFASEIIALNEAEYDILFPPEKLVHGGFDVTILETQLGVLLDDAEVDMILALGPAASHVAGQRKKLSKPTFAPFVIDPVVQEFPLKRGASGRKNLSYLTMPFSLERGLTAFRDLIEFDKVAIVLGGLFVEQIPAITTAIEKLGTAAGVEAVVVSADMDAGSLLASLPEGTDALYLTPVAQRSDPELEALIEAANKAKMPTFAHLGIYMVQKGVLAGIFPSTEFSKVARRIAINVQRTLDGERPSRFSITVAPATPRLTINYKTAEAIGWRPTWQVLTEADVLYQDETDVERRLTITDVMHEVREANLALLSEQFNAEIRGEENLAVLANLLPSLTLNLSGRVIDEDRTSSLGNQPEWLVSTNLQLTQVLYSEDAWAGLDLTEHLVELERERVAQLELDLVLGATQAYLGVLQSQALIKIQRENLKRIRSNLELAHVRVKVGDTNISDVYRWEIELADARQDIISARSQLEKARIALNRLLHRPLEEPFIVDEIGLLHPDLVTSRPTLVLAYTGDPWAFATFRDFMVEEGLSKSVELRQLDVLIEAREREETRAYRGYYIPDVFLQGELGYRLLEAGEGSEPFESPMGVDLGSDPDELEFSLALVASLPLFEGNLRLAEADKAGIEIVQLKAQRAALAEQIEESIRMTLHDTGTTFPAIELSFAAAESARKNLDVVTDLYRSGAVSVVELTDAQTVAFNAEQSAALSVYAFLADLFEVERASSSYHALTPPNERDAFFERVETYFSENPPQASEATP